MYIALIVAILLGGGAAVAAENTAPGDVLYPVKINVTEGVRSALTFSAESEAELQANFAERRLVEAESLAAEGSLNTEVRTELENRFEGHMGSMVEEFHSLEENNETDAIAVVSGDFSSSLRAHTAVLADLAAGANSVTRAEINELLLSVRTASDLSASLRSGAETYIAANAQGDAGLETAANARLRSTRTKIAEAKSFLERNRATLSPQVESTAEARLRLADDLVVEAENSITAGAYAQAFSKLQEAHGYAQEIHVLINLRDRLDLQVDTDMDGTSSEENDARVEASTSASVEVDEDARAKGNLDLDLDL